MKEEEKKQVYLYLQNYIYQKQKYDDYIDYYELCNLDEHMTIEQLQQQIKQKKLTKLFHPDQERTLDSEFQTIFRECSQQIQDMKNIFSSESLKYRYDSLLKQQKGNQKDTSNINDTQKLSFTKEEENHLERAIETTIYKYGFYQGYIALQKAARDDFSSVTKDNNSRELLKQMGSKKIKDIIKANRVDIMETKSNNIVMDYYNKIINKSGLKEKAEVFYNACLETAKKYDLHADLYQTDYAISYYIEDLNMDYFTNKNVDKQELCKLSPKDIQILISAKMHTLSKENKEYLFSDFSKKSSEEQIRLFSKEIKKEARKIDQQKKAV